MTSLDTLKNRLIDQILMAKNEKLLQAVCEIFQSVDTNTKIDFNSYQIEMIQMGLQDLVDGNTVSESDLEKLDAEWMD